MKERFAKPEPRKRARNRERRTEAALIKEVREECVERDGYCRVSSAASLGPCAGESEWAHLEGHKRFQTRGMAPEQRHATTWTAMLCTKHHRAYDAGTFRFWMLSESFGADEGMRVTVDEQMEELV